MTKVKSREEKLQEAWLKYFKNIEIKKELCDLLEKYIDDVLAKEIKKYGINPSVLKQIKQYYNEYKDSPYNYFHIEDNYNRYDYYHFAKYYNLLENKFNKHMDEIAEINKQIVEFHNKKNKINYFSALSLGNFKGFSEKHGKKDNTIKIKPITLIYGPNSYGKSSIIQSLLVLNQTINEGKDYKNIHLLPNGNLVKLGSFKDFLNKKSESQTVKIEITLPYNCYNMDEKDFEELSFSYNYIQDKTDKIILSELDIFKRNLTDKDQVLLHQYEISDEKENIYNRLMKPIKSSDKIAKQTIDCERTSFFTINIFTSNGIYGKEIFDPIENIIKNIVYVSSYRTKPDRYYIPENNRRKYVGKNGEYTSEILGYDNEVIKNVNKWLEKIAGYKLSLKKDSNIYSLNLNDCKTKVKDINLLDLGSGIAQVLPIITQAFKSENEMILIEEPEIHLHPKAQADLGEMFADAALKMGNTFIIETHSENLLLRLEKLIRRGELSKDDISVIYVDKDENGSHCIPLILNDEGDITNINDVPNGFFEEGFNELFDISR